MQGESSILNHRLRPLNRRTEERNYVDVSRRCNLTQTEPNLDLADSKSNRIKLKTMPVNQSKELFMIHTLFLTYLFLELRERFVTSRLYLM